MIKTITVTNHLDESLAIELRNPEKSGFLFHDGDGFGPPKASISTTEVIGLHGSKFNSARATQRNLIIPLEFVETATESIEDLRHKAYKYFPITGAVKIRVETETRTSEIMGYVESDIPTIFSNKEGTTISIICPDPWFYSVESHVTLLTGVSPKFKFPFTNNSLTQGALLMGTIENLTEKSVYYEGDMPTGVTLFIHAIGEASNIRITNTRTREVMELNSTFITSITGSGVVAGDDIIISTVKGEKYIYLVRNGVFYNIRNCLGRNADWFQIEKGDNLFAYAATGLTNLQFRIENRILYEGI